MHHPKPLQQGATIGLVQLAGAMSEARFVTAIKQIEALGFVVYHLPELPRKHGYLGGTDQQRLNELHHMFSNSSVDAIWCVRGGYGTQRYLKDVDYELIANNPKPIIGFSDITALLNAISNECQLVSYHGIMGVSAFSDFDIKIFRQVVMEQNYPVVLSPLPEHGASENMNYHPYVITKGKALGQIAGGNLALLCAAIGTDFDVDYSGKILILEDVGEAPYRVDRMLNQLLCAGKLENVAGIALGIFDGCLPENHGSDSENSLSLKEVFTDALQKLGVPVVYGLPFGHISENATLPIGAKAMLDANKLELTVFG